jgi:hypothetical protein
MLLEECLQAVVEGAMAQDGVVHAHNLSTLAAAAAAAQIEEQHAVQPHQQAVQHGLKVPMQLLC